MSEVEGAATAPPVEEATLPDPAAAAAAAAAPPVVVATSASTEPAESSTPSRETLEEKKEPDVSLPAPTTKESEEGSKDDELLVEQQAPPTEEASRPSEASPPPPADDSSPAQQQQQKPGEPTGKGAQIFRNRFQSMKERANQNAQTLWSKGTPALSTNAKAVQERAGNLWKAAPSIGTLRQNFQTKPDDADETTAVEVATELEQAVEKNDQNKEATTTADETATTSTTTTVPVDGDEVQPNQFSLTEANISQKAAAEENETEGGAVMPGASGDDNYDDFDRDSSVGGASDAATKLLVGRAFTKASLAATVAYESVLSTGFRGRYNASGSNVSNDGSSVGEKYGGGEGVTDTRPAPASQTELILKSRVGQHMQEILDKLDPHEYAMLLGRGMLGVNLKQCYLKNHGVFVDFLVPGGQAEGSGVVRSGDLPVRLADLDLRKGTILDIPKEISRAKRPVILTLATGTKVPLERMNFIDVAVAMMHRARDYYTKRGTLSNLPSASSSPQKKQPQKAPAALDIKSMSEVAVPPADTIDSFLTPPAPSLDVRREFVDEVPLRYVELDTTS
jgi:chemotaxis protein histidine kinase CheA